MDRVSFTRMDDGSAADFALLLDKERAERPLVPARLMGLLRSLDGDDTGYQVSRLEHSLQTATRAMRDGADDELVFAALLHDAGDLLAPDNHAEFAAALIAPYVSERVRWIVEQHGIFQGFYYAHHWGGDRNARERFRSHPWFDDCAHFCATYDMVSFDPGYDSLPLEDFEPLVRRVVAARRP